MSEISMQELEAQHSELLPEREALGIFGRRSLHHGFWGGHHGGDHGGHDSDHGGRDGGDHGDHGGDHGGRHRG